MNLYTKLIHSIIYEPIHKLLYKLSHELLNNLTHAPKQVKLYLVKAWLVYSTGFTIKFNLDSLTLMNKLEQPSIKSSLNRLMSNSAHLYP